MRILLICERLDGTDGWSRYSLNLKNALLQNGHEVITCTTNDGDGDYAVLPAPLRMMTRPWLRKGVGAALQKIMQEKKPDVLHYTVEPYALSVPSLPKALRSRCVLTIHGNYGVRPLRWWASRRCMRKTLTEIGRCITVSSFTFNKVFDALKSYPALKEKFGGKACTIPNGIPLPPAPRPHVRRDRKEILFVGAVKGSKGVMEALRGCSAYHKRFGTDWHFRIAGALDAQSAYVQSLQAFIADNGLQDHISFVGRVDDATLEKLYAKADVFLMPSITLPDTFEGFGLVYIEANAHGVPVIGPSTGGAAETIGNGVSGFIVDPSNAEMIANRMHRVLDNGEIHRDQCREWAERNDIRETAKSTLGVYNDCVAYASN
jgi:glycosyltransferase involved in cell wall biosynthesis